MASIIDKNTLLEDSKCKRLILIGGSNVAFGVDSKILENEFTDYDVINMGLHAGIGLKGMLNDVKPYIKENDIIIVIPEYNHFYGSLNGEAELLDLIKYQPENIKNIDLHQLISIVKNYPYYTRSKITFLLLNYFNKSTVSDVCYREAFNQDGDLISHLDKIPLGIEGMNLFNREDITLDEESFTYLSSFKSYVENKGGKIFFSYPSIPMDQYTEYKYQIDLVNDFITKDFKKNTISTPKEYTFLNDQFYDSVYHLNKEGRYLRSMKLLKDIKTII